MASRRCVNNMTLGLQPKFIIFQFIPFCSSLSYASGNILVLPLQVKHTSIFRERSAQTQSNSRSRHSHFILHNRVPHLSYAVTLSLHSNETLISLQTTLHFLCVANYICWIFICKQETKFTQGASNCTIVVSLKTLSLNCVVLCFLYLKLSNCFLFFSSYKIFAMAYYIQELHNRIALIQYVLSRSSARLSIVFIRAVKYVELHGVVFDWKRRGLRNW